SERNAARKNHAINYHAMLKQANELYLAGGDSIQQALSLFDTNWENVREGQAWSDARASTDEDAARLCIDYPLSGEYLLNLRLHPQERIRWIEPALAWARRLGDLQQEGHLLSNLAQCYSAIGDARKAIELFEQSLVIARQTQDRTGESYVLDSLGSAYT